eukprot:6466834-Amphidinium_carterae.1
MLTKSCFRNTLIHRGTIPHFSLGSDHLPIVATFRFRFASHKRCKPTSRVRYHSPTKEETAAYARAMDSGNATTLRGLCAEMRECAERHLRVIPPTIRKKYMSREAEDLLRQRDTARIQERFVDAADLDRQFRKRMRQDKKQYLLSHLDHFDGPRQNWKGVKMIRNQFTPKVIIRGDAPIRPQDLPEKTGDYFYGEHWKQPPHPRPNTAGPLLVPDDIVINDNQFTLAELSAAIRHLQTNKSPGPDD